MKTTRWKPDTCKCEIEYEWDDSIPQNERVHVFKRFIQQCPHHQEADWSKALQHNQEKNQAIAAIKLNNLTLLKADGEFMDNVTVTWKIEAGKMFVAVDRITETGVEKVI